jgi:predicted metalloendopeptidase
MVTALQESVESNVRTLDWMDDSTRTAALEKSSRMATNIKIDAYSNPPLNEIVFPANSMPTAM